MGRARLEGVILETIRDWAVQNPADLVAFREQQNLRREELWRTNGISLGGNMRHVGEIPTRLVNMISKRIGNKDWLFDPKTREIFYQNFPIGLVAKGGRMDYELT